MEQLLKVIAELLGVVGAVISICAALTKRGRQTIMRTTARIKDASKKVKEVATRSFSRRAVSKPAEGASKPVLRGISGHFNDVIIEMADEPLVIGRDPRLCQLIFPPTATGVSKRHCILQYDINRRSFILEDYWSTNGTFLESGEQIEPDKPRHLKAGAHFFLGDDKNIFEVNLE